MKSVRNVVCASCVALLVLAVGPACKKKPQAQGPSAEQPAKKSPAAKGSATKAPTAAAAFKAKELSVTQLAAKLAAKSVTVCDANRGEVRKKFGVIPGAVLLTSAKSYDPEKVLPKDKSRSVVFYCSSTFCSASDKAARKAHQAGWKKVAVLRVGIKGWKKAGQKTTQPTS